MTVRTVMQARAIVGALTLFCGGPLRPAVAAGPEAAVTTCTGHLLVISRAQDAYRRDHGELPPHLSELYPRYLADKGVLHCPNDASPGRAGFEANGIADPKLPNSYLCQMTTDPRPFGTWWLGPGHNGEKGSFRHDLMLLRANFGDHVPVVSCYHHGTVNRPGAGSCLFLTIVCRSRRW